ncbi:MAG: OsmC family protein [Prevotellaceae bacterium]|jgi:putative redox protein|nr:OsmC family protein [Prevotellaceae bacterium]
MIASVNLKWTGGMSFDGEVDGFKVPLDTDVDFGGGNSAPRPKKLLLLALAGCTAMDVVSLLRKMRVEVDDFVVDVDAGQTEEEHPHVYKWFKIIYKFKGKDLNNQMDKLKKAIDLSMTKYCGVSAMLAKVGPVSYDIKVSDN